tara:strand:+ start:457 stop:1494 length:1038 start_codon:yes stop_codon:yes gene_type:complete
MATTYKTFLNNDVTTTRTLLHEAIPITGSIVSGTYADANIKTYTADLFEGVYDYPYLSSSANHIFDITCGYAPTSDLSASAVLNGVSAADIQNKINMYNEMAKVLVGHDVTGSIQDFDQDGDLSAGGAKIKDMYALNFARLLVKDEIKKGSFTLTLGSGTLYTDMDSAEIAISDYGATNDYRVNSPAGEYGILYSGSSAVPGTGVGLLYYQAGVAILSSSVFGDNQMNVATSTSAMMLSSSTITANADSLRHRFMNLNFNNTTELNSTIYFCRANHNEFNYSANPTYLSSSQIVVKQQTTDAPVSFITSVGLYSADNELLGVAKISEPLKKDPNNELILRVRLDY